FLMIDGDHTYEGVRQDFEMYAPLVGDGSPIAFHDILPHPEDSLCEVDRFWNEIRSGYRHVEFIDVPPGAQYGGIGVLYCDARSATLSHGRPALLARPGAVPGRQPDADVDPAGLAADEEAHTDRERPVADRGIDLSTALVGEPHRQQLHLLCVVA